MPLTRHGQSVLSTFAVLAAMGCSGAPTWNDDRVVPVGGQGGESVASRASSGPREGGSSGGGLSSAGRSSEAGGGSSGGTSTSLAPAGSSGSSSSSGGSAGGRPSSVQGGISAVSSAAGSSGGGGSSSSPGSSWGGSTRSGGSTGAAGSSTASGGTRIGGSTGAGSTASGGSTSGGTTASSSTGTGTGSSFDWGTTAYNASGGASVAYQGHYTGQQCVNPACHKHRISFGGTVYQTNGSTTVANAQIGIRMGGTLVTTYSGSKGNFYANLTATGWATAQIAIRTATGTAIMPTNASASGDCNTCHNSSNRIVQP